MPRRRGPRARPNPPASLKRPRPQSGANDLIEAHLSLALSIAHKAASIWPNLKDELESVAMFELVLLARRWDPSRAKFTTFAHQRIWGACQDLIRKNAKISLMEISLETIPESLDTRMPLDLSIESAEAFDHIVADLPGQLRAVLRCRYVLSQTFEEIGRTLGFSKAYAHELHDQAIHELRITRGQDDAHGSAEEGRLDDDPAPIGGRAAGTSQNAA